VSGLGLSMMMATIVVVFVFNDIFTFLYFYFFVFLLVFVFSVQICKAHTIILQYITHDIINKLRHILYLNTKKTYIHNARVQK
jgi:hypothetical protein